MRAMMREVPEEWLAERARMGLDLFDEMWDGVLHMVPPPGYLHQTLGGKIFSFLEPRFADRGIEVRYEMGVYRPGSADRDYRVPDLVFFPANRPELISHRGLEGAPLAVLEIRSPDDETYDKFDFWAMLGVPEAIVLLPETRATELYRLAGGRYMATSADPDGRLHAATIDVRFTTIAGAQPRLRIEHASDSREI